MAWENEESDEHLVSTVTEDGNQRTQRCRTVKRLAVHRFNGAAVWNNRTNCTSTREAKTPQNANTSVDTNMIALLFITQIGNVRASSELLGINEAHNVDSNGRRISFDDETRMSFDSHQKKIQLDPEPIVPRGTYHDEFDTACFRGIGGIKNITGNGNGLPWSMPAM